MQGRSRNDIAFMTRHRPALLAPRNRERPRRRRSTAILAALHLLAGCSGAAPRDPAPVLLAAASTIDAVESAIAEYEAATGEAVVVSFASSATLARQIEEGAPADLMLAASSEWVDYVARSRPVAERASIAGNRLVAVVPATSDLPLMPLTDLLATRAAERFAIADPAAVPAGVYASEALRRLGMWEAIEVRLIPTVDVRAALALAAGGQVDAAFVYATDAASSERVRVIADFDTQLHAPIEYPLVLLQDSHAAARSVYDFLTSARGRAHFIERGFSEPGG